MVSDDALADLAERITSTAVREAPAARKTPARRRRWLIGIPAAAGLAAAVLIATSIGRPGDKVGPVNVGPARADAQPLVFKKHGRFIDVIVRNPVADPERYRAEFKAHGLDITLKLIPVSPSIVGTVVEFDSGPAITPITAKGKCFTGGAGNVCPVGLRVPVGYRGEANLAFGRAARPGERYEATAPATAPGEVMHGMHVRGRTVAAILAMLRRRHVTVPVFHFTTTRGIGELLAPSKVPGTWYVYDADPWAPRQVMLSVGPSRVQVGGPNPRTPVPAPSPSSSR
jgi:hypothetical protein